MIKVDYTRDALLTDFSKATLKDRYLLPTEKSPQDAFARAAEAFSDSPEMAQRIYDYASKLWFMFASPILSNGGTDRGLPISCFLNYVPDSISGIIGHHAENGYLSVAGGGIGGYWGNIRSKGIQVRSTGKTPGLIPFMKVVDSQMLAFNQAENRRGSYAAYLDIHHPEIIEFLDIRKPTGGDIHRKCLNLHQGVNITDEFMELVENKYADPEFDDSFALIDPHTKEIVEYVGAKSMWQKIIQLRVETGEPYLHFIDTTNRHIHYAHKSKGLKVVQSNLCSEILLPTNEERTAVCCLSSVNLETWDEWKDDGLFISDLVRFLDNVLQYFIDNAPESMSKAIYSASRERSIGLGAMGFHSYLQSKSIAIESDEAKKINEKMFFGINRHAQIASHHLAFEKGCAPDIVEVLATNPFKRNVYVIAIAPNASSSILTGSSPSIEPFVANIYKHNTLSGTFIVKNKYLEKILADRVKDPEDLKEVWKTITANRGSVAHVEVLTDLEKEVFKTAKEINQNVLVELAADRTPYIDQGQSLNLFFTVPKTTEDWAEIQRTHFRAWKQGLKTLYYLRTEELSKAEDLTKSVKREHIITKNPTIDCIGCED